MRPGILPFARPAPIANARRNAVQPGDEAAHDWYRFVLSFPPHLVRDYLEKFGVSRRATVLDPFCGTGTTLVECRKLGIPSVGVEALPVSAFVASTKVDWSIGPAALVDRAIAVARRAHARLAADGISDEPPNFGVAEQRLRTLPPEAARLLFRNAVSPLPLHKTLVLLQEIRKDRFAPDAGHDLLALAAAIVGDISNLRFGPEVGLGRIRQDAAVVAPWLFRVRRIAADLETLPRTRVWADVVAGDSREIGELLPPRSVDAVITSPPYPNEKDYTRAVRTESVLLGFLTDKPGLRSTKAALLRSNSRTVYKADRDDDALPPGSEVAELADRIEARRLELGKTSGFEKQYHRVVRLYFGGMTRHLESLKPVLRPGARLAYVVGDQASFFRIMIRTGRLLAGIAGELGYVVEGIDLFRTRRATVTRAGLREEVLLLRWPG